jgi:hypothetical protein
MLIPIFLLMPLVPAWGGRGRQVYLISSRPAIAYLVNPCLPPPPTHTHFLKVVWFILSKEEGRKKARKEKKKDFSKSKLLITKIIFFFCLKTVMRG